MSEIQIAILICFVRIFITGFMLEKWRILGSKKFILLSLFVSFIYSSIFLVIAMSLFRPVALGFGLVFYEIINEEILIKTIFTVFGISYLFIPFWLEYKNSIYCLGELYPKSTLFRANLFSNILSIATLFLWLYLSV